MKAITALTALALTLVSTAYSATLTKGTDVTLAFDQAFSSRNIHNGDKLKLHVLNNVSVGSKIVLRKGTRVTVIVTNVQKSGRFGKNGQINMAINPIRTLGTMVELQARQRGDMVKSKAGLQAAGAAGAGAIVLGPIGLGAGYFIVGHSVYVKVGDKLETEVLKDVRFK